MRREKGDNYKREVVNKSAERRKKYGEKEMKRKEKMEKKA